MGLKIRLLGVRGSLPTPYLPEVLEERIYQILEAFSNSEHGSKQDLEKYWKILPQHLKGGYGGNTTSVDIRSKNSYMIIDGGTGIRRTVPELMGGPCGKGKGEVHLFFTHFHWDHLLGIPFFVPIYIKGNRIHLYSVGRQLEEVMRVLFKKPYFPVPYEALGAQLIYHDLKPRHPFLLGDMSVTPYQLDHPDPCWGYKIESEGKVYSHCVDSEGLRTSREDLGADLPLYQGVNLMAFDGQYTVQEASEKVNWGHSSAPKGLEIAIREGIKKVVFMHHDPWATDNNLSNTFREAQEYYEKKASEFEKQGAEIPEIEWYVGKEGMSFEL